MIIDGAVLSALIAATAALAVSGSANSNTCTSAPLTLRAAPWTSKNGCSTLPAGATSRPSARSRLRNWPVGDRSRALGRGRTWSSGSRAWLRRRPELLFGEGRAESLLQQHKCCCVVANVEHDHPSRAVGMRRANPVDHHGSAASQNVG